MARPVQIVPSVLPADFSRLGEEVRGLEEAGADRIQWDVMDGRFVPNLTMGPDVIAAVRPHTSLPFEAHLMVESPEGMLARYVEAGCEVVIVHAESTTHLHRALGAEAKTVRRMFVWQGGRVALVGIVVGMLAAVGLTKYITTLLFNVGRLDVLAFAGMSAVMLAVALLASYVPALRASRVDPVVALRAE